MAGGGQFDLWLWFSYYNFLMRIKSLPEGLVHSEQLDLVGDWTPASRGQEVNKSG